MLSTRGKAVFEISVKTNTVVYCRDLDTCKNRFVLLMNAGRWSFPSVDYRNIYKQGMPTNRKHYLTSKSSSK